MDLRSSCLLDRSLGTVVVAIRLGVSEFLDPKNLEFSALFDE